MNKQRFILFIDSGIGGLSILNFLNNREENLNIIYYADREFFPYGEKDNNFIRERLINIVRELKDNYDISMIVLACNSATVSAISYLREQLGLLIVGTVPAIKEASKITVNKKIALIATERTVNSEYIKDMIEEFCNGREVMLEACPLMVKAVEEDYSGNQLQEVFKSELERIKNSDVDVLVLGCTHFFFLFKEIEGYLGNRIKVIDAREGVAKRIISISHDEDYSDKSRKILLLGGDDNNNKNIYDEFNKKYNIFNEIKVAR